MRTRRSTALTLAVVALLAAACGGRRPPGSMAVVLRFVEPPPQEPFHREAVVEDRPVFDWRLKSHDVTFAWLEPQARRHIALSDAELEIVWEGDRPTFVWRVDLEAAAVDRIDLVAESLHPETRRTGDVAFYWAAPGEPLAESRKLVVTDGEAIHEGRRRYPLKLAGEPEWRGRISTLKVAWAVPEKVRVRLLAMTGYDEEIAPGRLRELAAVGITAAIAEQFRDALPALPGAGIERRLTLPPEAELRFAYGSQGGVRAAVRFTASVVGAGGRRRLFAATVAPGSEPGWREATVDLSAWAGEDVRIVLEAEAEGELDLAQGLPLWGHPEVLAPR
jgi:hypothetical protein